MLARERLGGVDAHVGVVPRSRRPTPTSVPPVPEAGHEDIDLGAVGDDLLGRGLLVGARVRGVAVLVGHHEALVPRDELVRQLDRTVRAQEPGESMISAPNSASSCRRSWVTLSGSTTATR